MRQLRALASKPEEERSEDDVKSRVRDLIKKVENMCTSAVCEGEIPNPMKIIQMHMKHVLFNSEKVKGMYSIIRVCYYMMHSSITIFTQMVTISRIS